MEESVVVIARESGGRPSFADRLLWALQPADRGPGGRADVPATAAVAAVGPANVAEPVPESVQPPRPATRRVSRVRAMVRERLRPAPTPARTGGPSQALRSSAIAAEALRALNAGETLTIKDVMARLHCAKDKAIRTFRREPGVVKTGKAYLIPQSVFDRVVARSIIP